MKYFLLFLFLSINLVAFSQTVEDDFEGNGTISAWGTDASEMNTSFSNPYKESINTSNTVLEYTDNGGQYANVFFDVFKTFNLSSHHTFSLKIYVPSDGLTGNENNQISLKLQDNTLQDKWTTQSEIIKSIVLDEWQTITFDFKNDSFINLDGNSADPINRTDFNRVLIQINGENNNAKVKAYIDDFLYDGVLPEDTSSEIDPVFNNLVWSDEFNGTGAIDDSKWFHQTRPIINGESWANGEIQHYTDRIDNSYVSNGTLKILAKKETYTDFGVSKNYTSARLNSKFAFTYGKVEIKAKMPFGAGTFPALWMLGKNITETGGYWSSTHGTTGWPDCGEIDIIEHWGTNQNFVQSALHNRSSFGGTVNHGGRVINNASTEFHVYTLEWNANKMIFSVDGIVHYTYNPEEKNTQNWPYNAPQYVLFNVAILPSISSTFTESAMEVDYIRIYQESTASTISSSIEEISIYPNPVNDQFTIKSPNLQVGTKATIYNLTGSKVKSISLKEIIQTIDCSGLNKGIYFLKLESNTKVDTFKILKN